MSVHAARGALAPEILLSLCLLATLALLAEGCKHRDARGGSEDVAGWGVLRMGMSLADARAALRDAGIAFRERAMAKDATTHLLFDREWWQGTAYFDARERLTHVQFQSPEWKNRDAADGALQELEKRLGKADEVRTVGFEAERREDTIREWRRQSAIVQFTLARYGDPESWVAWEAYSPSKPLEDRGTAESPPRLGPVTPPLNPAPR